MGGSEAKGGVVEGSGTRGLRPPDRVRALAPLAARWHLLLPGAVTGVLAFVAGGFFAGTAAVAAVVLLVLLVGRITLASQPFAGWSAATGVMAGALALLAAWILVSTGWSHAPARALPEFDLVLLYALLVVLCAAARARERDLAAALRWSALAMAVVGVLALLSRLAPEIVHAAPNLVNERLSFPLTYWNADGILLAMAIVLALHLCAAGSEAPWLRVAGAVLLPPLAVALYLTFSRGGIAAAILGAVLYAALAHPRTLPPALLAAAPPTAFAVVRAYDADLLARPDYATSAAAHAQGRELLWATLAAAAAAGVLRAVGLLADRRLARVRLSRRARRGVLAGTAGVVLAAVVAVGIAIDAPARIERLERQITQASILPATGDLRDRLTQFGSNGRIANWRVARDAFEADPARGTGAGTYKLLWERDRRTSVNVNNAHSLYLETAAELGVPGLVMLLVALLTPVAVALRRLGGGERHAYAAFLAAGVALLAHAGVDWDWEMPALFAWWFGASGVVLAARGPARAATGRVAPLGRVTRVVAGLACLLVAATPWLVATSQAPLDSAVRAFLAGDCRTAVDGALTSAGRLSVRPEPFELLGLCDARLGQARLGVAAMRQARRRDPGNWQYAYGLALVRAVAGEDPRPAAAAALRLNPLDARARALQRRLAATTSEARWRRIAQRAPIPID